MFAELILAQIKQKIAFTSRDFFLWNRPSTSIWLKLTSMGLPKAICALYISADLLRGQLNYILELAIENSSISNSAHEEPIWSMGTLR